MRCIGPIYLVLPLTKSLEWNLKGITKLYPIDKHLGAYKSFS